MDPSTVTVSANNFIKRYNTMQSHWKERWDGEFDCILLLNGRDDENAIKIKISAMHSWLFGYEFTESIIFFTKNSIIFILGAKRAQMLEPIVPKARENGFNLELIVKDPQNGKPAIESALKIVSRDTEKASNLIIGAIPKEKQFGKILEDWEEFSKDLSHEIIDISPFIQELFLVKDQEEQDYIKKSGKLAAYFETKVIEEVERIIDDEQQMKHSDISTSIENLLSNNTETNNIERKLGIDKNKMDISYTCIQSGGEYDMKPRAESTEKVLCYDTIICKVGAKYCDYNTNVTRTLFIDPTSEQKSNYLALLELQNNVASNLRSGVKLKTVYENAYNHFKDKHPNLVDKICKSFGAGIGLEFRESISAISDKIDQEVKEGMVFNITIWANDLRTDKYNYAIMISDTYLVKPNGIENLTGEISKKYEDVSYSLDLQAEPEKESPVKGEDKKKRPVPKLPQRETAFELSGRRKNTRGQNSKKDETSEQQRKEHQRALLDQKQKDLEDRLQSGDFKSNIKKEKALHLASLKTYSSINEFPKDYKKGQICVDYKHNALILPINGIGVPIHISVLKSISKHDEDNFCTLRLNFHVPGSTSHLANITFPELKAPYNCYLRELTFKNSDGKKMADIFKKVKELQKKFKQVLIEEKENSAQETNLIIIKGKRPILQDLKVRPNISGKKTSGTLEAHQNGFRYISNKSEKIDVLFSNVKHAFFQPCDGEMIILIHVHLHNGVLVGKKKTNDIQFYTEAGIQTEDLDTKRRNMSYQDELDQEENERNQRRKLNQEFENFVKAVEALAKDKITFDIPYRDLGFYGTPFRSNVFLLPTVNCLVNLTETPFFIMTLDDIEVAHFERISFGLKNFDLVFIFKNYDKPVIRISAIPTEYLESIKNWLDHVDILFSESNVNLIWNNVLKEIRDDPDNFVKTGGWGFLQESDNSEVDEEEENNGDSEFSVRSEEMEDEEESDYSEEEDEDEDEDDEDFDDGSEFNGDDEDLSEEGLSWDEMERETQRKDEEASRRRMEKVAPQKKRR